MNWKWKLLTGPEGSTFVCLRVCRCEIIYQTPFFLFIRGNRDEVICPRRQHAEMLLHFFFHHGNTLKVKIFYIRFLKDFSCFIVLNVEVVPDMLQECFPLFLIEWFWWKELIYNWEKPGYFPQNTSLRIRHSMLWVHGTELDMWIKCELQGVFGLAQGFLNLSVLKNHWATG